MSAIDEFVAFEQSCQAVMDDFYQSHGHVVASREGTRRYDVILKLHGKQRNLVEEKFRLGVYDDLLVELIQDVCTGSRGWYYETRCDHLHYVMCEDRKPKLLYRVPWKHFQGWLVEQFIPPREQVKEWRVSGRGWGLTLNLVVPIASIPPDLLQSYEVNGSGAIPHDEPPAHKPITRMSANNPFRDIELGGKRA